MNTTRENLEVVVAWLDAMRRADVAAVEALLEPTVTWRGLPADAVCRERAEVLDMLRADELHEGLRTVHALELVAGDVERRLVCVARARIHVRPAREEELSSLISSAVGRGVAGGDILAPTPLDPSRRPLAERVAVEQQRDHHRRVVRGAALPLSRRSGPRPSRAAAR